MQDITRKVSQGMIWSFLGQGINKGLTLVTLMILARLLTKADFGLVAAASILISYLFVYKDMGLGNALIQFRGDVQRAADSVFWLNLLLGVTLTVTVFFAAPFVSRYFESTEITPILRCLGLSFTLSSLGAVHIVLLRKELSYKKKAIADIGGALVKGIVSVVLALLGFGVWSIVFGQLAGATSTSILAWIIVPWRPRLFISREISSGLLKFGGSIMGIDTIGAITENLSYIIVGKVCGIAVLGIFTLSYRLPEVFLIGNLWVLSGVFFPMFSLIQHDTKELRSGFLVSVRLVSIFATLMSLWLFILAEPLINVMYGAQWIDAIPILKILACYAWIHSFGFHAGDLYKAIGRPNILLALAVGALAVELIALVIGSQYGITGVAIALLSAKVITRSFAIVVASRLIKVSIITILLECKSAVISGFFMTIIAVIVAKMTTSSPYLLQLIAISVTACFTYLGILWVLEKENILFIARKIGFNIR